MADDAAAPGPPRRTGIPARPRGAGAPVVLMVVTLTGGLVLGALLRVGQPGCVNDQSRWDTVWALVERGTYVIDEAPWAGTIDKVQRDGHFYSSKPALLPTLVAGEYWLIRRLTPWKLPDHTELVIRTILVTVNLVPLLIYVWLYGAFLLRHLDDPWWRAYWLVAAAIGSYVTAYSVTFNNHTVAAWSAFFALYSVLRIAYEGSRSPLHFALAGFFSAFAVPNEFPSGVLLVVVFAYLVYRAPQPTLLFFVPGALLPTAAYLITTYLSTGGFIPYYAGLDTSLYQYEGSYWTHPQGIDALHEPKWFYLFNMLIGHHGIFSLTPVNILAAVSMFLVVVGRVRQLPAFAWMGLIVTPVVLGFYTFKTGNYGGYADGLRWTIWMVPLWMMIGPLGVQVYGSKRWVRALAMVALLISVMSVARALGNPWNKPWLEELAEKWGWINYYP